MNPRICIVSEYARPYLMNNKEGTGGAELQLVLIARELVKKDYDVHMVVFSDSENSDQNIKGIKVHSPYDNKNKGIAHFHPFNLSKFFSLLNKIDPDIFIQSSSTPITGLIALFAKIRKKIFVFRSSSNANVSSTLLIEKISDIRRLPYIYGVKNANCVVSQTDHQKELLKTYLPKKKTVVIRNITPIKLISKNEISGTILWVGRINELKRPELYLDLAKNLPEYNFRMVGSPLKLKMDYYNKIKGEAEKIGNLDFLGYVPHIDIGKYYSEASVLVSTSSFEGFPNTFLEAWIHETPIISLGFDPDNLINGRRLGFAADDFDDMVKKTRILMENNQIRQKMGVNGRIYVEKNHSEEEIISSYEKLFRQLTYLRDS